MTLPPIHNDTGTAPTSTSISTLDNKLIKPPITNSDNNNNNNNDNNNNDELQRAQASSNTSSQTFQNAMESFLIISLAGFGGALAGISIARGRTTMLGKKSPFLESTQTLPNQWAITCMGFASIFETVRWVSPTSLLYHELGIRGGWEELSKKNGSKEEEEHRKAVSTIGDYTIAGMFAGAIFKGAAPSTSSSPSSPTSSSTSLSPSRRPGMKRRRGTHYPTTNTNTNMQQIKSRTQRMTRIQNVGSGLALGFVAGWLQYGLFRLNLLVEEYSTEALVEEQGEEEMERSADMKDLEEQVKHMSIVELQEHIDRLKQQS